MSQRNGDKSRFNRERKQRIRQRVRNRKLLKAPGITFNPKAGGTKPD